MHKFGWSNLVTIVTKLSLDLIILHAVHQIIIREEMNTESWCKIERSPKQEWTRAERRHNNDILRSSVFKDTSGNSYTSKLQLNDSTTRPMRQDIDTLTKRRHYQQKCKRITEII